MPSKSSISDPMPAVAVTPATPMTVSTSIIPSPSSVSIPTVVQHEPAAVSSAQSHVHPSIPNSHHHVNERSQTADAIAASHHVDQTMLTHQHQLTSVTGDKSLIGQHEYATMGHYDSPIYTYAHQQHHHQPGSEFMDYNQYNNYYPYEDQTQPFSSSSCSSSNSEGDSQMTVHAMHPGYSHSNNIPW